MKNSIIYFVVLLLLFTNCTTTDKEAETTDKEADKAEAIAAIHDYYKAGTSFDYEAVKTYCSDDFSAIENGTIYDNLAAYLEPAKAYEGATIEYDITIQKTVLDVKSAILIIKLNAVATINDEQQVIEAIESYSLVKENGKWLIRFIHSTYLNN